MVDNFGCGIAEDGAVAPRGVPAVIGTHTHLLEALRFKDVLSVHVGQTRLVEEARSTLAFVVFGRDEGVEGLLKLRCAGHQMPERIFCHIVQASVARIGPRFYLGVPHRQRIPIGVVPGWNGSVLVSINGETKFRINANLHQIRPRFIDAGHNAVYPVPVVDF